MKNEMTFGEVIKLKNPLVLFDIGGTLMDGPDKSPSSRFAREINLSQEEKDLINQFIFIESILDEETLEAAFLKRFPNLGTVEMEKIRGIWHAQVEEGFAIDGAFELLDRLAALDVPFGIVSDIWRPYFTCFERIFARYMHLFKFRVLSFETGAAKPSPKLYRKALDCYSSLFQDGSPADILMIGDSYRLDMAPSMQMGMKAAWILYKPERELPFMADVLTGKAPSPQVITRSTREMAEEKFDIIKSILENPKE